MRYRNHYRHVECPAIPKGEDHPEWSDEWSCMCNDECPNCGAEIEPYDSEDLRPREDDDEQVD